MAVYCMGAFTYGPYVKLNVLDYTGTLLKDTQKNHAITKFCNSIE